MQNIVGNSYDKFGSKNPLSRWLMDRFLETIVRLAQSTAPKRVLEVGCGEGKLVAHLHSRLPSVQEFAACDLSLEKLDPGVPSDVAFKVGSAYELPYADNSFDLVVCAEVLEHLEYPERALAELCRTSSRYLLVSTPREPLWRLLNLCRLAYVKQLGNTPGHIQHFSPESLERLLTSRCNLLKQARPIPWVVMLTECA